MNCDFIIDFLAFILAIIVPAFLILHIYKYISPQQHKERFDFDIIHPASLSSK
jgi:hypothetical protein